MSQKEQEENKKTIEYFQEEIKKAAENSIKNKQYEHDASYKVPYKIGFEDGAKWMFENIFKFIKITD